MPTVERVSHPEGELQRVQQNRQIPTTPKLLLASLDHVIGVQIPASQPISSFIPLHEQIEQRSVGEYDRSGRAVRSTGAADPRGQGRTIGY